MRTGVFAYGSLVDLASASETLGRPIAQADEVVLEGWRRSWSLIRHNPTCEKTFARKSDGWVPEWILVVDIQPDPDVADPVNGVVFEIDADEVAAIDRREFRYHPVDVTAVARRPGDGTPPGGGSSATPDALGFDRIIGYSGREECKAPSPLPPETVVMRTYAEALERGFSAIGPEALQRYRDSTGEIPTELMDGVLVRDRIEPGNPRGW